MSYAKNTNVSVTKSQTEIQTLLTRYGAQQYISGFDNQRGVAMVGFTAKERQVRFTLPLPKTADCARTATGRTRTAKQAEEARMQEERRRWRALALCIKAKLESVDSGIATFEQEFLANIVMPNGATVGEVTAPLIASAYETGSMPQLLPAHGGE